VTLPAELEVDTRSPSRGRNRACRAGNQLALDVERGRALPPSAFPFAGSRPASAPAGGWRALSSGRGNPGRSPPPRPPQKETPPRRRCGRVPSRRAVALAKMVSSSDARGPLSAVRPPKSALDSVTPLGLRAARRGARWHVGLPRPCCAGWWRNDFGAPARARDADMIESRSSSRPARP